MSLEIDGETYYTATEAAIYLGISRPSLHSYVKQHPSELPPFSIGIRKRPYYRKSDLDKLKKVQPS